MTMFAGLTIPMTASFLYLMGYSPYGMDPVPMVMCLTSFLYLRAFFMDRLTAAPIAKERVFESMRDGKQRRIGRYYGDPQQYHPGSTAKAETGGACF
ncbi:Uncharacterised protein [Mycobacteroides abscessus subsp. abscessus]|nr:Uncharacterised protein [Mycobacteroides abscessus subsp. abscessus]